jgi:hypothetical protein
MTRLSLIAAACTLASAAAAQNSVDFTRPSPNQAHGFVPAPSFTPTSQWNDDFNRPNAATLGADWTQMVGSFGIFNNRGNSAGTANSWAQHNTATTASYATSVASVDFYPSSGLTYVALLLGVGGAPDNFYLKVQDNNGDGLYDYIGMYRGINGGAWPGGTTGFAAMTSPAASGRMSCYFTNAGDTANLDLDTDFDGLVDQHYESSGILGSGMTIGTGFGIGAYGTPEYDDWRAGDVKIDVAVGGPPCFSDFLDFDDPFVPSGPIASNSPVFAANGIDSISLIGAWAAGGDVINAGSNGSGQTLVSQGGVLSVTGVGGALDNAAAGAGYDLVLSQPTNAISLLFVDQTNMNYDVELLRGAMSLGVGSFNYTGGFPNPPRTWRANLGWFDHVRITFPVVTGGVGIDNIALASAAHATAWGVGGVIPSSGSGGGGNAGTVLPTSFSSFSLSVPVPPEATRIRRVVLSALSHTWSGDLQLVLWEPTGTVGYNLVSRLGITSPTSSCCGFNCDFGGHYEIVDPSDPAQNMAWPVGACGSTHPSGIYPQEFGVWVDGSANVFNTPLGGIPPVPGNWTLAVYDGASGDVGSLAAWTLELEVDGLCGPEVYCISGTTTNGCNASISANANPSVSLAHPCTILVTGVEGQKNGILFYGLARNQSPWCMGGTSFLCAKAPTQRTGAQLSGGTMNACDGSLSLDWNAYQSGHPAALGNPWSVGDDAWVQAWFRDPPACKTTSLSNGVHLVYQP